MKLLQSNKVPIPLVYLVSSDDDLRTIPIGIPFIRGSEKDEKEFIKLLEFEVIYKSAIESGLPFNWKLLLKSYGYNNFIHGLAFSSKSEISRDTSLIEINTEVEKIIPSTDVKTFLADISYKVDIDTLKDLKVIPTWFSETIEQAVKTNILDSITWNSGFYNKKLNDISGAITLSNPNKNLIIIDISGSIPTSIAKATLLLSKTMSLQFYADLIITGAKSGIFEYSEVSSLDIDQLYQDYGQNNECKNFRAILSESRQYDNVIVFSDYHSPLDTWGNVHKISKEQANKICKFRVNKIFSFHTTSITALAGYAEMFDCENIEYIKNWVKYLD